MSVRLRSDENLGPVTLDEFEEMIGQVAFAVAHGVGQGAGEPDRQRLTQASSASTEIH